MNSGFDQTNSFPPWLQSAGKETPVEPQEASDDTTSWRETGAARTGPTAQPIDLPNPELSGQWSASLSLEEPSAERQLSEDPAQSKTAVETHSQAKLRENETPHAEVSESKFVKVPVKSSVLREGFQPVSTPDSRQHVHEQPKQQLEHPRRDQHQLPESEQGSAHSSTPRENQKQPVVESGNNTSNSTTQNLAAPTASSSDDAAVVTSPPPATPPLAKAAPRTEPVEDSNESNQADENAVNENWVNPTLNSKSSVKQLPNDSSETDVVAEFQQDNTRSNNVAGLIQEGNPFLPSDDPNQYLAPPAGLDQSILIDPVKRAPKSGWRKIIHSITAGYINLGDSEKVDRHQRLIEQVRSPLRGDYKVAVLSLKGGVGKTTTSVMLGGIFASLRGDRVIAIDANPDFGNLAQRAAVPRSPTIRDLLGASDIKKYSDVRMYTTQAESNLEVIGSDRDPEISEAFSESDYRHSIDILQHYYNIILTDCGTGLMHSAMKGVLDLANTLILVTSPALDGAQSASATLDWLSHQGYGQFVANAIVVVSSLPSGGPSVDVKQLVEHFQSRTRAVQVIPYDRHLSEGAIIDLERLDRKTYMAYLELAALVAQDFASWHRHAR